MQVYPRCLAYFTGEESETSESAFSSVQNPNKGKTRELETNENEPNLVARINLDDMKKQMADPCCKGGANRLKQKWD